jgi:putative oxidoreductase
MTKAPCRPARGFLQAWLEPHLENLARGTTRLKLNEICERWSPQALSVLRLMTGLMIVQYGLSKVIGFPAVASFAQALPFTLIWFAGLIELIGGALLIVGLFTRPVAFVVSGLMAFAYFMGHAPRGFIPLLNGGNLAVMYCFACLYLFFASGGPWSLDALVKRKI